MLPIAFFIYWLEEPDVEESESLLLPLSFPLLVLEVEGEEGSWLLNKDDCALG